MNHSKLAVFLLSLAAALLVAGCGESDASTGNATIGGTITGLPGNFTVLLVNNGSETIAVDQNGSFAFNTKIQSGSTYNVTLFSQPAGKHCTLINVSGTVDQNTDSITNVSVNCAPAYIALYHYNVGVTVSGLAPDNTVTFLNNGGDPLKANGNGLFVFSKALSPQVLPGTYGVAVSVNATGQTCTLGNNATSAAGIARTSANFVNVLVTCK
jgi:hypothetical protein